MPVECKKHSLRNLEFDPSMTWAMKTRIETGLTLGVLVFSFIFSCASGQGSVNLSAGFGLPELLHIGVRYQIQQFQVGGGFGFIPAGGGESVISLFGDVHYHFAGQSRLSDRRPWYGKAGFNYLRDENASEVDKWMYLNARIGRDFNFSKKVGLALDVGASFQLSYTAKDKIPSGGGGWTFSVDTPPVVPGICLAFFVRL